MKKGLIIVFVLLLVSTFGLVVAESNETREINGTSVDISNKSLNWSVRCAAVGHMVEGRLAMFEENRDPHFERFIKMVDLLDNLINKSYSKGYNTTLLDSDLAVLNEKILKFQEDYLLFIQKLNNTRNFICGHSEGQYHLALNESKAQLRLVKQDVDEIKQFYGQTIKQDIKKLREQKREEAEKRKFEREQDKTKFMEERRNVTSGIERMKNWTGNGTKPLIEIRDGQMTNNRTGRIR